MLKARSNKGRPTNGEGQLFIGEVVRLSGRHTGHGTNEEGGMHNPRLTRPALSSGARSWEKRRHARFIDRQFWIPQEIPMTVYTYGPTDMPAEAVTTRPAPRRAMRVYRPRLAVINGATTDTEASGPAMRSARATLRGRDHEPYHLQR